MKPKIRALLVLATGLLVAGQARAVETWAALREPGAVLIVRHAETEPGIGDPPGFRIDDCATQRNLSETGRKQAVAMGRTLAERGVTVTRVESSRWCRCADTARLAFPQLPAAYLDALNSFFEDRSTAAAQTRALRARIAEWKGPGVLVLVTHQVNISALTGRATAMGEAVVLRPAGGDVSVLGTVRF
jgi:broad specificity phosphatase PhoE